MTRFERGDFVTVNPNKCHSFWAEYGTAEIVGIHSYRGYLSAEIRFINSTEISPNNTFYFDPDELLVAKGPW